ncbi:hypothetical protein FVB43_20690 [Erwinia rhapontici]|uniref:hypothetical protein n=1 Tax=Erwinia rhapontici TaxID=55212 RepID=UPI0014385FA7|nr:hypothetical protein [Erwinia rhapontici]NKG32452.1 hypothetical protein [Erwinia rhapontici]
MKSSKKGLKNFIPLVQSNSIDYNKDRNGISFINSPSTNTGKLQLNSDNEIESVASSTNNNFLKFQTNKKNTTNGDLLHTLHGGAKENSPIDFISNTKNINTNNTENSEKNSTSNITSPNQSFNHAIFTLWNDASVKISGFEVSLSENKKEIKKSKIMSTKLMGMITTQQAKLTEFDTLIFDAEERLNESVKSFEGEVVNARNSILAVIALFASFFTFISISVNIFSKDMQLSTALAIILILWSCTLSFIFVFMAGISKGGEYFTSTSFVKHCAFMLFLFIFAFIAPKVLLTIVGIT